VTNHPTPPRSQIRQIPYIPARTQCEFARAQPVSFSVNGVPGISVAQAIAEDVTGLDGRDDGISSFENSKVLFRTQVGTMFFCRSTPAKVISSSRGMICVRQRQVTPLQSMFILLIRFSDKYSTSRCRVGTDNPLQTREGDRKKGPAVYRGECVLQKIWVNGRLNAVTSGPWIAG
jgi:hypothetical protein